MAERLAPGRRAAVLGSPIAHSLSPALHRAAYAGLGLDWTYEAIEVDEAGLPDFLAGLDGSWAGLSLTMPLKVAALALAREVEPTAALVRSVNTLVPVEGGWRGANTDIDGITRSLSEAGLTDDARTGAVLGAGATARSALAALVRLGVRDVVVCARRAEAAADVASLGEQLGARVRMAGLAPDPSVLAADVVVSTLPGDAAQDWAAAASTSPGVLLDASYHPWPTPLARAWGGRGIASGRDMLLWQAVEQVRMMTGLEPPVDRMAAALPE